MERDRSKSGRYNDRIDPNTILEVFENRADRAEPLTAADVVDETSVSRRTAHNKLNILEERGVLETKKVGARGRVWWTPDYRSQEGHSTGVERSEPVADESPEPTPEATENEPQPRERGSAIGDELKDELRLTLPGSGSELDERVNAVLRMHNHIRDQDGDIVRTGELKELVDEYNHGYKDTESFWNNAIKKNAAQERPNSLTSLPGIEELGNGRYQYNPDENDAVDDPMDSGVYDPTDEFQS